MRTIYDKVLKGIYAYSVPDEKYGLHLLFQFVDNSCIEFDSSIFQVRDKTISRVEKTVKWHKVHYPAIDTHLKIVNLKEDENVSYFVEFSNGDILYIYQRIVGNVDDWFQDFEIVTRDDTHKYNEVFNYMNEDFVEDAIINNEKK